MSRLDDAPQDIEYVAEDEATVDESVPDEKQSDDVSFLNQIQKNEIYVDSKKALASQVHSRGNSIATECTKY